MADKPTDEQSESDGLAGVDDMETLPRVGKVGIDTRVKRVDPPKEVDAPKANIA